MSKGKSRSQSRHNLLRDRIRGDRKRKSGKQARIYDLHKYDGQEPEEA